jgi:superoxide reductase
MITIDRREFLKTTVVAVSAVTVAGSAASVFAGQDTAASSSLAGLIYTKEQPGQWQGKEGSHAPTVTVTGSKVTLLTPHPMTAEHFIVRHTLVLADGTVVGAKTFVATDKPESSFDLPTGYKGKLSATSFCNQHDFWLTTAEV